MMLDVVQERVAPRAGRIDRGLAAAIHFLVGRQAPDGTWQSDVYGTFKDGNSLTPLVLHTLLAASEDEDVMSCVNKGAEYLASLVRTDPITAGPHGLNYPTYTAALTVLVLSQPGLTGYEPARVAWLRFLKERQLADALGWLPEDVEYGGWGYCHGLPRKPAPGEPGEPYTESNLSATVAALEALRAARHAGEDPAVQRALHFVHRCQNYAEDPAEQDPAFDDGGFFFIAGDPARNKAGVAGRDLAGRTRYASYGSTTADGLRALLACGLPTSDARMIAARRWLEENFSASTHPGKFPAGRRAVQAAVYYYYCWSLARALTAAGVEQVSTPAGPVCWAEALAEELLRRQRPDGSWINDAVEVREDDPLVATSLAAGALTACRRNMTR